jgi:hypothetical protein
MVAISKESVARSKDNKGRRMQLVMLSTCCLLTVVVAVKLLFHLENKTMKFRIRYDGKTYVAKVKVGNVTKAYYELYDGLPDRDEIFASLFGESAAIAEATEEVKESSSNVEPRTSATNPIEGGTVKIEMPKGRALDNYDALEPFAPVCTTEQLSKLAIQVSKPNLTNEFLFSSKENSILNFIMHSSRSNLAYRSLHGQGRVRSPTKRSAISPHGFSNFISIHSNHQRQSSRRSL